MEFRFGTVGSQKGAIREFMVSWLGAISAQWYRYQEQKVQMSGRMNIQWFGTYGEGTCGTCTEHDALPISEFSFTIHHREHSLCSMAASCVVALCSSSCASSFVLTLMHAGPAARRWLEHDGHRKAIPGRRAPRSTRLKSRGSYG